VRPTNESERPSHRRFGPIKTRRIFEEICDEIRSKLASGELKPGDRLPSERELSEMFQVSRTGVREAFRSLEIAGLVDLRKGSKGGAYIRKNSSGAVTQSIRDMVDFGHASLTMLLDARLIVMEAVIQVACERGTEADFDRLQANIDVTQELTLAGRFLERTYKAVEFNTILAEATQNQVLAALVEPISEVLRSFIVIAGPQPHDPVLAARRELLSYLRARQPRKAAQSMRTYLEGLHAHLLRSAKKDALLSKKEARKLVVSPHRKDNAKEVPTARAPAGREKLQRRGKG